MAFQYLSLQMLRGDIQHTAVLPLCAAAVTTALVLQGLKVKFSGVKAPAAKDLGGNAQLDKDEQKKQAKLRKAQKALGL